MKKTQELLKEITEVTYKIEKDYPELYQYLDENPITIPIVAHPAMSTQVFSDLFTGFKKLT